MSTLTSGSGSCLLEEQGLIPPRGSSRLSLGDFLFHFVLNNQRCSAALWACQGLGKGIWACHEQTLSMLIALPPGKSAAQTTSCTPHWGWMLWLLITAPYTSHPATRLPGTPGPSKVKITPQMQQKMHNPLKTTQQQ